MTVRQLARVEGWRDMSAVWGDVPGIEFADSIYDAQRARLFADRAGMLVLSEAENANAIRLLDNRLATIGITENAEAFNAQRQSIADHLASGFGMLEIWDAQNDKTTCDECWGLNGTIAGVGEGFPGGLRPGAVHARCRCTSHFERIGYH